MEKKQPTMEAERRDRLLTAVGELVGGLAVGEWQIVGGYATPVWRVRLISFGKGATMSAEVIVETEHIERFDPESARWRISGIDFGVRKRADGYVQAWGDPVHLRSAGEKPVNYVASRLEEFTKGELANVTEEWSVPEEEWPVSQ